jgi:hypothetical protein
MPEGGLTTRPGTVAIGDIAAQINVIRAKYGLDSTYDYRMIPFEFGPSDSYVVVIDGDFAYFIRNGAINTGDNIIFGCTVVKPSASWTIQLPLAAGGGPLPYWSHGYDAGDTIAFVDESGTETAYTVTSIGAGPGYNINVTGSGAGTTATVDIRRTARASDSAEITYVMLPLNISTVRFVQSGDVLFFSDGVHDPKKLTRESRGNISRSYCWRTENAPMIPSFVSAVTRTVTGSGSSAIPVRYRVTVTDGDGVESAVVRSALSGGTVTVVGGVWRVNEVGHGLVVNDTIIIAYNKIKDTNGALVYKLGDKVKINYVDANNFEVTGSQYAPDTGSIGYYKIDFTNNGIAQPASATPVTVTLTAVAGATQYNFFREFGRVFGYVGSTRYVTGGNAQFVDNGVIPDIKDTPVVGVSPCAGLVFPTAIGLFQQRLTLGGFSDNTERLTASHIGNYSAFDPGAEDSSGIDFDIAGRTVSNIKHLLEISGRSIVLTGTAEWVLKGGSTGSLTPTAINARADSYHGSSDCIPALVGSNLLYAQRGGKILRDMQYDSGPESLVSRDLTLWAKHLFKSTIRRIVYQRTEQLVWVLLDNGKLLCLTYIPDQEVWGWSQHSVKVTEDDGDVDEITVYDICGVSESERDRLYVLLNGFKRSGNSQVLARLATPWEEDPSMPGSLMGYQVAGATHYGFDACHKATLAYSAVDGALSGGVTWAAGETMTLTGTATFDPSDVGKVFILRDIVPQTDGTVERQAAYVRVTVRNSASNCTVVAERDIPVRFQTGSFYLYRDVRTISGLDLYEGMTLKALVDDGTHTDVVVSGGAVTLSRSWEVAVLGCPMVCQAKTLRLESSGKDSLLGATKHITQVLLDVVDTRGAEVGLSESTLEPMRPVYNGGMNAIPTLQDGQVTVLMSATHDEEGSIVIRQDQGLPTTILNARPIFNIGEER